MSEPTIALCVACYLGEHDRCGPPCDCTHDGPPAPRDGRYVADEDGVWWPREDVGPRVDADGWDRSGPAPRPTGTDACEWCGFWHEPGEECSDAPATVVGVAPEASPYVSLHTSEPAVVPGVTRWISSGDMVTYVTAWDAPAGGRQVPVKLVNGDTITITVDFSGARRALRLLFGRKYVRRADRIRRRMERSERTAERQMHQDYRRRQIARRRRRRQR